MKKKSTTRGGNIQLCVKSGVQYPHSKIGIMATDDEAYKTFGDLFGPIIKELHPGFDFRYSYKFDPLDTAAIDEQIMSIEESIAKVSDFKIEVNRNFRSTPFSPLMTKEAKLQVERKVVEVLGDLYGSYTQVKNLKDEDCDWIKKTIGFDPKTTNKEHDAGGINEDWPVGRGVFIQDKKDFMVFVNFEEHLRIVVLPDKTSDQDNLH